MLIEQLAFAHLNIGRLHFRSATADGLEGARVYGALAIGLTGEFRRTALALKAYRERSRAIEAGPSQAATSPADGPGGADDREGADTEQGSKPGGDEHDGATLPLAAEPAAGRGRPVEQVEKRRGLAPPGVNGCGRRPWPTSPGSARPGRGRPWARPGPPTTAGRDRGAPSRSGS